MKNIILMAVLAFSLIGCGDPKEATESNFKVSIQRFLDATFPVCVINQNFPVDTSGFSYGNNFKMYDEMTKLGLLTKAEDDKPAVNKYAKVTRVSVYDLTDEGRKYYQLAGKNLRGDDMYGFCFGKASIKEIIDFTQPADMLGTTISRVNFTYTVSGLPDWVKKPEIVIQNEQVKKLVDATEVPVKAKADMVLTNKGWKHRMQDLLDEQRAKITK